jgi:hypothetical protein
VTEPPVEKVEVVVWHAGEDRQQRFSHAEEDGEWSEGIGEYADAIGEWTK